MSDQVVVFVRLLHEGTDVWRPVKATQVSDGLYQLTGKQESEDRWEFGPGSLVRCALKTFSDGASGLVARGSQKVTPSAELQFPGRWGEHLCGCAA